MSVLKYCKTHSSYSRKFEYDRLILEEEGSVLEEILKTAAKEKLKEAFIDKIGKKKWNECFNVAKELIKSKESTLSEKQNEEWEEWKIKHSAGPSVTQVKNQHLTALYTEWGD